MENGSSCSCRLLLRRPEVRSSWPAIVEAALHFPVAQIELPPCTTMETGAIGLTLAGERPTHFLVPAAKKPGDQVSNRAPRRIFLFHVRIIDDCQMRLHFFNLSNVP